VKILKESFSHMSEQWEQSHEDFEDHGAAIVSTITKVPTSPSFRLLPPFLTSAYHAAERIRKDVVLLAAQSAKLHITVNSSRALGISGGGGKSVTEIVDKMKEIQALSEEVEKFEAKNKAQLLALESLRANAAETSVRSFSRAPPRGTFVTLLQDFTFEELQV
jgi:hypothetical protein